MGESIVKLLYYYELQFNAIFDYRDIISHLANTGSNYVSYAENIVSYINNTLNSCFLFYYIMKVI